MPPGPPVAAIHVRSDRVLKLRSDDVGYQSLGVMQGIKQRSHASDERRSDAKCWNQEMMQDVVTERWCECWNQAMMPGVKTKKWCRVSKLRSDASVETKKQCRVSKQRSDVGCCYHEVMWCVWTKKWYMVLKLRNICTYSGNLNLYEVLVLFL